MKAKEVITIVDPVIYPKDNVSPCVSCTHLTSKCSDWCEKNCMYDGFSQYVVGDNYKTVLPTGDKDVEA